MVNDLIKSIKLNIYERVTSPLLGTFVVSWCLWNYRFIITLLWSKPPEEKFEFIDTVLFKNWWPEIAFSFGGPLIVTLVFIFAYPYPAKWVYQYWRSRQKELKEVRQKIEDETLLSVEESRIIKEDAWECERKNEETLKQRESEILQLKAKIAELTATRFQDQPPPPPPKATGDDKLELEEVEILKCLSKKAERSTAGELMADLRSLFNYKYGGDLLNVFTHHVDGMVADGLVSVRKDTEGLIESVKLEKNGRTYLIENNIIEKKARNLRRQE